MTRKNLDLVIAVVIAALGCAAAVENAPTALTITVVA